MNVKFSWYKYIFLIYHFGLHHYLYGKPKPDIQITTIRISCDFVLLNIYHLLNSTKQSSKWSNLSTWSQLQRVRILSKAEPLFQSSQIRRSAEEMYALPFITLKTNWKCAMFQTVHAWKHVMFTRHLWQ